MTFCASVVLSSLACVCLVAAGAWLLSLPSPSHSAISSSGFSDDVRGRGVLWDHRGAAGDSVARAGAAPLALGAGVAPWLSGSNGGRLRLVSFVESVAGSCPSSSSTASPSPSGTGSCVAYCDSSAGLYPYQTTEPWPSLLESPAASGGTALCGVLVPTSSLPTLPTPTFTVATQEPSGPGSSGVVDSVDHLRLSMLFAAGLMLLLAGAMLIRGKW